MHKSTARLTEHRSTLFHEVALTCEAIFRTTVYTQNNLSYSILPQMCGFPFRSSKEVQPSCKGNITRPYRRK